MIPRPWVVLLAAGASRRYRGIKLLARVGGQSLLRRMARVALLVRPAGCVVVLGAHDARLRRELAGLEVRIVFNPRWREGMSRSLAAGVAALPADARGALVLLADQAGISPADLELLHQRWRRAPRCIVAAIAGGRLGPPAILPRPAFPELRRLRGDRGARELLRDPRRRVIGLELPGAALDVDFPSDLATLRRVRGTSQRSMRPAAPDTPAVPDGGAFSSASRAAAAARPC
jgi:molybdenum cofactor cytidylyltransferase